MEARGGGRLGFAGTANAVNNDDVVAGNAYVGADPLDPRGHRAFVWREGRRKLLPTPDNHGSWATDINDNGLVVGGVFDQHGRSRAVAWSGGRMIDLAGQDNLARAVNNRGQIVGESIGPSGDNRAVLWEMILSEHPRMTDLGNLGGDFRFVFAQGINEHGQVVGYGASTSGSGEVRPFLWQKGKMSQLADSNGVAWDINDRGQAVGWLSFNGAEHAVRWSGGRVTDLGAAGGDASQALALNENGAVAGVRVVIKKADASLRAVVWQGGRTMLLPFPEPAALPGQGLRR